MGGLPGAALRRRSPRGAASRRHSRPRGFEVGTSWCAGQREGWFVRVEVRDKEKPLNGSWGEKSQIAETSLQ